MRRISEPELKAILGLDGPDRFRHFVKRVADDEQAWALWRDGWAMMADMEGLVFPLWPAREYAELCRLDDWASHEVRAIGLEELLEELIPKLKERGIRPAAFPTPGGRGIVVSCLELADALRAEMGKYDPQ